MKTMILAASALAAMAMPATAQQMPYALPPTFEANTARLPPQVCPEGRTRDGRCVNPVAAQLARQTAITATQSKISMSAGPPVSPAHDAYLRYPNAAYADIKREADLQLGRRSSSYVPHPYHPHTGAGTPFPPSYPVRP